MKNIKQKIFGAVALLAAVINCQAQTNALKFTNVKATSENAVQLFWASKTNAVYEVDYADQLAGGDDGSTIWQTLYTDYPSHGTNTFIGDFGNYFLEPPILHPSKMPMRFYRVFVQGTNAALTPTISITSPTNGATVSSNLTVKVSCTGGFPIKKFKLFVDGQEMPPSDDGGTNFVINTCEWPNGQHTLFATVKTQSKFSGGPNPSSLPVFGQAVSAYKTVTFDNLITSIAFSEPYFDPALGQTQQVSAVFAANVNWTLQIQDESTNTVRTVTGSGVSMQYNWDGTGDGGTNIPDGVYTYLISAQTNGLAFSMMMSGGGNSLSRSAAFSTSEEATELWALPPESSAPPLPLALYPPGLNTNGFTIFEATKSEVKALTQAVMESARTVSSAKSAMVAEAESSGGFGAMAMSANTPKGQNSRAPKRPPTAPVKSSVGTVGVGYQTYYTPSSKFTTPPIPKGGGGYVALDDLGAGVTETWPSILENKDLGNDFITAMKGKGWKPTIIKTETNIIGSDLTGGTFNQCNLALISLHGSFATSQELDGVFHTYLRFLNNGSPSYVRLDDCSFGGSGSTGLKWLGLLACSVLRDQNYDSMYNHFKLPINNDLHLLCSASTIETVAPNLGQLWAQKMLGVGTNTVETVKQAWFDAGSQAYIPETNHIVITFRVAGWPDAFGEHLSDINSTPGTGDPSDIIKNDTTVFSNP